jgi:hypothetical protein
MKKTVVIGGTYFKKDSIFVFEPYADKITLIEKPSVSGVKGETKEFTYNEGKRHFKFLNQVIVAPNIDNIIDELLRNEDGVFHFSINGGRVEFMNKGKFVEIKITGLEDAGIYKISTKQQYHWKIIEALKRLFHKHMLGGDAQ